MTSEVSFWRNFHVPDALQSIRDPRAKGPVSGCTTHTHPAHSADRSSSAGRTHEGSSVEPIDLLAALVDEAESRAAELMAQFGLDPARVLNALGTELEQSRRETDLETLPAKPNEPAELIIPLPHSAALRAVLFDATTHAKAIDRGLHVGTEHLLAGLMAESSSAARRLLAHGLELDGLRSHLWEQLSARSAPPLALEEIPPLDLFDPARAVDIGRILDASANRTREGLRVVEDYARFVLDDPGLTRRLKEVRHRLAEALRGFDPDLLIGCATRARTWARTS